MTNLKVILGRLYGVRRSLRDADIEDELYRKLDRHIGFMIRKIKKTLQDAQKGQMSLDLTDELGWPIEQPVPTIQMGKPVKTQIVMAIPHRGDFV